MISELYLKECLRIRKEYNRLRDKLLNESANKLKEKSDEMLELIEQYEYELESKTNMSADDIKKEAYDFLGHIADEYNPIEDEIAESLFGMKKLVKTSDALIEKIVKRYPNKTQQEIQEEVIKYITKNNVR